MPESDLDQILPHTPAHIPPYPPNSLQWFYKLAPKTKPELTDLCGPACAGSADLGLFLFLWSNNLFTPSGFLHLRCPFRTAVPCDFNVSSSERPFRCLAKGLCHATTLHCFPLSFIFDRILLGASLFIAFSTLMGASRAQMLQLYPPCALKKAVRKTESSP